MAIISIMITDAVVNVRERNVRRSSRARSVRCSASWRPTNAAMPRPPTTNGTQLGSPLLALPAPIALRP